MADVQLKLVKKTNDGVFGKAINNFNKILYSPSSSFFNIAINSKRNTVVKNFLLSESYEKNVNEKKKILIQFVLVKNGLLCANLILKLFLVKIIN